MKVEVWDVRGWKRRNGGMVVAWRVRWEGVVHYLLSNVSCSLFQFEGVRVLYYLQMHMRIVWARLSHSILRNTYVTILRCTRIHKQIFHSRQGGGRMTFPQILFCMHISMLIIRSSTRDYFLYFHIVFNLIYKKLLILSDIIAPICWPSS